METPGNTLHAPHACKPDAGGSRGADLLLHSFSLSLSLSLPPPTALVHSYYHPLHPHLTHLTLLFLSSVPALNSDLVIAVTYGRTDLNAVIQGPFMVVSLSLNCCPLKFEPRLEKLTTDLMTPV